MKTEAFLCFLLQSIVTRARLLAREEQANSVQCIANDKKQRALIQTQLAAANVPCENMCKKVGAYPNCQCPGFEGQPASEDDTRKCMDKYCQDPKTPCPTDAFIGCVKESTKGSLMQWDWLLQRVNANMGIYNATQKGQVIVHESSSCQANDKAHRALIQMQLAVFDVKCEEMCKRVGAYPHCQCPGFEGQPATAGDTRKCAVQHCQYPKTPCPTNAFIGCVKESTKTSLSQWGSLLQNIAVNLERVNVMLSSTSCLAQEHEHQVLIQAHLVLFNVPCEDMCKKVGAYPNCQCPGFEGQAASAGDTRKCMDQYCQDPRTPCPTDAFIGCVKEATKGSLIQWQSLYQRLSASLGLSSITSKMNASESKSPSCVAKDEAHRALIQTQLAVFNVKCEDMCKRVGAYPNCQCPGFAGQPASEGDTRKCMDQYCQDPKTLCPTNAFIGCVKETTKTSLLQWGPLLKQVASSLTHVKSMIGIHSF